uniref:Putative secreted protein n=1 Tax=Anopheles darlingi TaxID=43151 RepID=A0A2M4D5N2_ANODA
MTFSFYPPFIFLVYVACGLCASVCFCELGECAKWWLVGLSFEFLFEHNTVQQRVKRLACCCVIGWDRSK